MSIELANRCSHCSSLGLEDTCNILFRLQAEVEVFIADTYRPGEDLHANIDDDSEVVRNGLRRARQVLYRTQGEYGCRLTPDEIDENMTRAKERLLSVE